MALLNPRHARIFALGVSGGADDDPEPGDTGTAPEPPTGDAPEPTKPQIGDTRPAPEPSPPAGTKPAPSEYEVQLRNEVAGYRKRFEPYEKALGILDDDTRAGILELANLAANANDEAVRARVAEVFGLDLPAGVEDPNAMPMTRAEFAQWQRSQTEEAQAREHLDGLVTEAKSLGVEHGTPAWYSMIGLLQDSFARAEADPTAEPLTVEAAVKQLFAGLDTYGQSRIDEFVSGKGGPRPATGGAAPEGGEAITTFKGATEAAIARLTGTPG